MADPCLSCPLPDCDDRSPRCVLRRLRADYYAKLRRGEAQLITEQEREANNLIHETWRLERAAEASEGGRRFRRGTTVYGPAGHEAHNG